MFEIYKKKKKKKKKKTLHIATLSIVPKFQVLFHHVTLIMLFCFAFL
jgi:hypothetical protein